MGRMRLAGFLQWLSMTAELRDYARAEQVFAAQRAGLGFVRQSQSASIE